MNEIRRYLDIVGASLTEGVAIRDAQHMTAFVVAVAEAYDAAPRLAEADREAWDALNAHNNEVLLKRLKGTGMQVSYTPQDPYDDGSGDVGLMVRRMLWDMVMNHRLAIYSGHSDDHPVFSPTDNVVFRTVHDYYTHGKLRTVLKQQAAKLGIGPGTEPSPEALRHLLPKIDLVKHGNVGHAFTARGEFNSYSTHRKLAPPAAAPALFTEIIGQVSYQVCVGDFPQQKVAILHDFDYDKVGLAHPGSHAAQRIEEIEGLLRQGAATLDAAIKAKPTLVVADLMKAVTRNANSVSEGAVRPMDLLRQLEKGSRPAPP